MIESAAHAPDLSEWIGRTETTEDIASRSAVARLAAVLDRPFESTSAESEALFPLGHWLQFTPSAPMSELSADGHPRLGSFMPPIDLPRRMWAGSRIERRSPITVGQHLERRTTIEAITPKNGSTGRLCFVELRHDVSADEALALTEWQTIVYREAVVIDPVGPSPLRPPRADGPAPEGWDWSVVQRPVETTLFRYSALTFNSHRIHYDLPYTTGVEGYPGLVVQGPLLASYVVDGFLRMRSGADVVSFDFSVRAPVFSGEQIHVVGRGSGAGVEDLAVVSPDGKVSLTARIEYR